MDKIEKLIPNYISWLEYKKIMRIVRYYPTFEMYMNYRYFAKANYLDCFGGDNTDTVSAYNQLIENLKNRVA